MAHFDLVVIGGGAAGEKGAVQAAYFGKKVALIEKEPMLGGAMVNTGTLPSKTLRESALSLSGLLQRGLDGIDVTLSRSATVGDFLYRLGHVTTAEHSRIRDNLDKHGVTVFQGLAHFVDAHTLQVGEQQITADFVLIATGSRPHRPAGFPFEHQAVYDSDEIVQVAELPHSMAVVGGGVIGCEYACLFAALGAKVTIIEARSSILGFLDGEMVTRLMERMRALNIDFRFDQTVSKCETSEKGVELTSSNGERLDVEITLICAGRSANSDSLQLEKAGITCGKRGQIDVDEHFRTCVPHIAAVGDVIGFPALASTSMEQARVAVVDFFDLKYKIKVAPIFPYGIFTIPEVSMVGETEESLQAAKVEYVKGVALFDQNARGKMIGETGALKLLFRKGDMKLLGVHCIGESANELIHIGLTAMMCGATSDLFVEACFNYPTLSESYKYATYAALGERIE